ncbi:hypothetical protein GCM10010295_31530 [Streptomyces intermedius]
MARACSRQAASRGQVSASTCPVRRTVVTWADGHDRVVLDSVKGVGATEDLLSSAKRRATLLDPGPP